MSTDAKTVASLETCFTILQTVKQREPIQLATLADSLDYAKSTIHAHLKTMEAQGFVTYSEDGYRVGLRFLSYGVFARNQRRFFHASRDKVHELANETGERVWSVVRQDDQAVYLYGCSGAQSIQTYEDVGQFTELHCLAAGKAILAHAGPGVVETVVDAGLDRVTDRTITDPDSLREELATIREDGIAYNREESMQGVHAVAAPVRRADGGVYGALSIGGPANRLTEQRLEDELKPLILGAVNELEINFWHD